MLNIDMSAVKLPGETKHNLPPKCGQPIDVSVGGRKKKKKALHTSNNFLFLQGILFGSS
jgi:hypothetical protein